MIVFDKYAYFTYKMQKKYTHLLQIEEKYIIFAADLIPRGGRNSARYFR